MAHKIIARLIILLTIPLIVSCRTTPSTGETGKPHRGKPTATVVDAETGEPIEGAVAIAIWRKEESGHKVFWEGTSSIAYRIEEAVSDEKGRIFIKGFWGMHLFRDPPHLTVYKPKYVCWDQELIFRTPERKETMRRTDFNKDNRVVKMEKWKEGYSYIKHFSFADSVTEGDSSKAEERLFEKAFKYEEPFELRERHKNKRLREKRKRRNK